MNIDEIERAAKAATQEKWTAFIGSDSRTIAVLRNHDSSRPIVNWNGFDSSGLSIKKQKANALFMAAAQPKAVIALVHRIRELESNARKAV